MFRLRTNSSVCAANGGGRSFRGFYVWPGATAGRLLSFLQRVVAAQPFRRKQHLFSCKTLLHTHTHQQEQQLKEARRQKAASFISVALRPPPNKKQKHHLSEMWWKEFNGKRIKFLQEKLVNPPASWVHTHCVTIRCFTSICFSFWCSLENSNHSLNPAGRQKHVDADLFSLFVTFKHLSNFQRFWDIHCLYFHPHADLEALGGPSFLSLLAV